MVNGSYRKRGKMETKTERTHIIAEIMNKLTLPKTILENFSVDKKVSKELIKVALKDLDKAVELIREEQL